VFEKHTFSLGAGLVEHEIQAQPGWVGLTEGPKLFFFYILRWAGLRVQPPWHLMAKASS